MDQQARELDLLVAELEQEARLMRARMDRLDKELGEITKQRDQLRAFALDVMGDWPEGGDLDGMELQELMVKHGLLKSTTRTEPCCEEGCFCAGMVTPEEFEAGVECFVKTELLKSS